MTALATERVTPTVTFSRETLAECLDDHSKQLLEMHWAEIATQKDIPLDPDYAAYEALEAEGCLRCYILRQDRVLQGYAVFIVMRNMKYQTSIHATADLVYLVPSLRKQMIGFRFLQWAEEQLAKEGVAVVRHAVERTFNFGPLLERLGYTQEQTVYAKRLTP